MNKTTIVLAALALASLPVTARAQDVAPAPPASPFHADAEVDPTAYVLSGYSLHVGLGHRKTRLDVGNFALTVPRFVHGNDDFDVSFHGYGLKLQQFLFSEQRGAFVGVDVGVLQTVTRLRHTDRAEQHTQVGVGVHGGYRFELGAGFYATTWLGVGRNFGARDVTLDGKTFEKQTWTVFPAVHLGLRFR